MQSNAQLAVSKLVGKGSEEYGLGYGIFSFLDFPLASGHQSIRLEILDLALHPKKGEDFFTTTAGMKSYLSVKLGYKQVFSEDQTGFYILPAIGYGRVMIIEDGSDEVKHRNGIAASLESGYSLGVGQGGNSINLGLKYETDQAGKGYTLNSVGLRLGFSFNLFHQKDEW